MKITKKQIENMLSGQTLIVNCDNASEWESAARVAYRAREKLAKADMEFVISKSSKDLSVTVMRK